MVGCIATFTLPHVYVVRSHFTFGWLRLVTVTRLQLPFIYGCLFWVTVYGLRVWFVTFIRSPRLVYFPYHGCTFAVHRAPFVVRYMGYFAPHVPHALRSTGYLCCYVLCAPRTYAFCCARLRLVGCYIVVARLRLPLWFTRFGYAFRFTFFFLRFAFATFWLHAGWVYTHGCGLVARSLCAPRGALLAPGLSAAASPYLPPHACPSHHAPLPPAFRCCCCLLPLLRAYLATML